MASPTLTLLWASAAQQTCYFRMLGGIQSGPVSGVQSCYEAPIENYDQENYRDTFHDVIISGLNNVGATLSATTMPALTGVGTSPYDTVATPTSTAPTTATVPANTLTTGDDILHIPPRPELKKRSKLLFYNTATSAGSVVFSCWADEYIGLSTAAFSYI